jgi:hypothetical protein
MNDEPKTGSTQILAAITAIDEKLDRKFDELKTADDALKAADMRLFEEVQRHGRKIERMEQDLRDLKSDTTRRFDLERQEAKTTMEAIVQHVDRSAAAFQAKAADIDELKSMQVKQTAILERLDRVAANPIVRKVAYGLAMLVLAWLASRGVK